MTTDQLNHKILLCETALDEYQKSGHFTVLNLVNETGLTASDIYSLFDDKNSILDFYYPVLLLRYETMIEEIEDFDSYTISEKTSNFIYTMFDMMDERREFVEDSFHERVTKAGTKADFFIQTKELFLRFFTTDPNISVSAGLLMKDYFYHFLTKQYIQLVSYWLTDDSIGYERSIALTDKLTVFIEEIAYNKTLDKGFDLAKYIITQEDITNRIPCIGNWVTEIFKDESIIND